jgi:hypothetical protein
MGHVSVSLTTWFIKECCAHARILSRRCTAVLRIQLGQTCAFLPSRIGYQNQNVEKNSQSRSSKVLEIGNKALLWPLPSDVPDSDLPFAALVLAYVLVRCLCCSSPLAPPPPPPALAKACSSGALGLGMSTRSCLPVSSK